MSEATRTTREPRSSRFTQQELTAFRPVLTPVQVILAYLCLGLILIPLGAICLDASTNAKEVVKRYDNDQSCLPAGKTKEQRILFVQDPTQDHRCVIGIKVSKDLKAPIYVYYDLDNYYQNHRRYVKSRDDHQLAGRSGGSAVDCKPKLYQHPDKKREEPNLLIKPCGLTAWSYFNDTFKVTRNNQTLNMIKEGISWKSDRIDLFGSYTPENFNNKEAYRGGGTIDGPVAADERFIVWMRVASLPHFRKLYGILDQDLKKGDELKIAIENNYNTYLFGGKKKIVLSTTSWLGGHNVFLGVIYITAGCISVSVGIVYFIFHLQFPRRSGDERFLSWKRKGRG